MIVRIGEEYWEHCPHNLVKSDDGIIEIRRLDCETVQVSVHMVDEWDVQLSDIWDRADSARLKKEAQRRRHQHLPGCDPEEGPAYCRRDCPVLNSGRTSSQLKPPVGNYSSLAGARCPKCGKEGNLTMQCLIRQSIRSGGRWRIDSRAAGMYSGSDPMWCNGIVRDVGFTRSCGYAGRIDDFMKGELNE